MIVNISCLAGSLAAITLDGTPVSNYIQADDEAGVVWVKRINKKGRIIPAARAKRGDVVMADWAVRRLTGRVEIGFDLTRTTLTEDELRQDVRENCLPFTLEKIHE